MKFFICLLLSFSALAAEKAKPTQSDLYFNYEIDLLKSVTSDMASNKAGPYQILSFSGIGLVDIGIKETSLKELQDLKIRRSGSSISLKFRLDNFKEGDNYSSFKQIQECRILAQRWAVNERGIDSQNGGSYKLIIYGQQKWFDSQIKGILKAKNPSFETEVNPRIDKVECRVEQNKK